MAITRCTRALLLTACLTRAWGLDASNGTESANTIPTVDPLAGLTPAQQAQATQTLQQIEAAQNVMFPLPGQVNANLYQTVEAKRVQENLDWIGRYSASEGGNTADRASTIYSGDDFSVTGQWLRSPRFDDRQVLYEPNSSFDIIDGNKNLLQDFNKRLNKIANKLSHSKFACGEFDWIAQLALNFNKDALMKYVDNLGESALAAAPMALIANLSPTLYEIIKWLRANASGDLNAEKVSCHQMEGALTDIGQKELRGEGYAECIKANQGLGATEAQRICNQEQSPFDGIEDLAGNIKGLDAQTGSLNLTQELADRINSGQPAAQTAASAQQTQAQTDFNNAQAFANANPDPGDAPNVPPGDPQMVAWQAAKNNYAAGQTQLANATTELQGAVNLTNNSSAGPWSQLANSLSSNLGNIIGNIDLSAKANVQFGRQQQYQLIMQFKHHAYEMSLDFTNQLQTHYQILSQSPDDTTDLSQSYQHLQAYAFATMQTPWLKMPSFQVDEKVLSYQVRMTYDTLDRLAILWTAYQQGTSESLARTAWNDQYRFVECITTIGLFEIYDFLVNQGEKDIPTVMSEFDNMSPAKNGGQALHDAVQKSLDEYLALLKRKRDEQIPLLVQTLYAVNQFPLQRSRGPSETPDKYSPNVNPTAQPQMGR